MVKTLKKYLNRTKNTILSLPLVPIYIRVYNNFLEAVIYLTIPHSNLLLVIYNFNFVENVYKFNEYK